MSVIGRCHLPTISACIHSSSELLSTSVIESVAKRRKMDREARLASIKVFVCLSVSLLTASMYHATRLVMRGENDMALRSVRSHLSAAAPTKRRRGTRALR